MIVVNGVKIFESRKSKGLTQEDLAEGICKQATISNIERKNYCAGINILMKICKKLDLSLDEVVTDLEANQSKKMIKEANNLCALGEHKEALTLLKHNVNKEEILDKPELLSQYYYLMGNTSIIAEKNIEEGTFYFHKVLEMEKPDILYKILATNGMGIAYKNKNELNFAENYYKEAIEMIDNTYINTPTPLALNRVYYNTAKFFSLIKQYEEAIALCQIGITINKMYESLHGLDLLLYEYAFNSFQVGDENSQARYTAAEVVAQINENTCVLEGIANDKKEFFTKD